MKIISLKGQNLASLAAPFEINFASGILADAGLFAICGNTGSGKSTLLDAICLSLFDAMPRFNSSRRGPAIGHIDSQENERLKSNDVRHILTRGAASGFSEVIFELDDRRRFCARWSVKRARGSATGRIQAQEMSLTALSNDLVLATKKTEVLSEIEQLIGLNYEQFRRSVLLAQGDFAAFLKAAAKERSELLERITGTQMYSEISKLAFIRAKDEEQQLKLLSERLGEVTLLTGEQQQVLVTELGQINESMVGANEQANQLNWLERQLEQTAQLANQVITSQEQCQQAEVELTNYQASAHQIELVEHAQRARVVDQQIKANAEQHQQQQQNLDQLIQEISQQQQQVTEITVEVAQLQTAKTQASEELEHQLPRLETAMVRQFELNHLSQGIQDKQQQLGEIEHQQAAVQRRLNGNQQNQQRQHSLLSELGSYLSEHQHLANLVNHITTLEQGINEYLQAEVNLKQYDQQAREIKQTVTTTQHKLDDHQTNLTNATGQQQLHQQQLQQLSQYYQASNLVELEQQIEQQQQQLTTLVSQQQLANQGLQYQSMINDKRIQHQETSDQLEQTKLSYRTTREQLEQLSPMFEEAENALLGAQQIMSLTEHRAQLVAEQPCALCGSKDHPYASEVNLGERLIDQLSGRCQQLKQQTGKLSTELSQLEVMGNQLVAQQTKIISDIAELNQLLQALSDVAITPQLLAQIEQDIAALQQLLAKQKQQYTEQAEIAEQVRAIDKRLTDELHRIELLNQNIEQCNLQLQTSANELMLAAQYQAQISGQMQGRLTQLTELYSQADWSKLLVNSTLLEQFKQQLASDIEQFIEKSNYQAQLSTEQTELEQQKITLSQELSHLSSQSQPLQQQQTQDLLQQQQWQQELQQLCHGQDPKTLKRSLTQQFEQLATALNNAEQGLLMIKNQQLVSQNQQQQLIEQNQGLETQALQLMGQWQQWLAELELTTAQLHELLGFDHQWVVEQRQRQSSLLQQLHRYQAVLAEQQRSLGQLNDELLNHQHQLIQTLPDLGPEPTKTNNAQRLMLQQSIEANIKQLELQQFELRSKLEQHNTAMIRHGELQQQIDIQSETTQLWLEMKELIGAADGAKFRTFAQSLTLEQMLISANHHLKELAPRYQLQRVPGAELDLQIIDCDMGDDVRSIESLSGGETFLVSLALALGLGSITSLQTNIKTLFIDEGFGTLDPDTLEVALSCLDSLQATGRQIGLISHVEGLVERVGTRVQILAQGNGHSTVELLAR